MRNESKIHGITLVTLIITIIILLILAGVSISMIVGENGLLNKARLAVNKYQEASDEEQRILNDYYSKIMIATNDNSQVTISVKALKELIHEEMITMYPVGSIYTSKEDKDPSTFIGGKWQKIDKGRFLMNADDTHTAGTTVEAGLPEISGSMHFFGRPLGGSSGAFTAIGLSTTAVSVNESNTSPGTDFASFNASNSNAIYGRSNTVQPPAYVVYMWERIE